MKTNIIFARAFPFAAAAAFPLATLAVSNLCDLINLVFYYFNVAVYFIIGLATVVFVWNIFNYFFKPEASRKDAGLYVMYSVIGFFVIISFWGLVNIVKNTFKLDTNVSGTFGNSYSTGGSCVGSFSGSSGSSPFNYSGSANTTASGAFSGYNYNTGNPNGSYSQNNTPASQNQNVDADYSNASGDTTPPPASNSSGDSEQNPS